MAVVSHKRNAFHSNGEKKGGKKYCLLMGALEAINNKRKLLKLI